MNPRTRKAALYAIGVIAILASANALAHSYAGSRTHSAVCRETGTSSAASTRAPALSANTRRPR
jgi:hypothetical protein